MKYKYADLIFIDAENNNNRSCIMKQIDGMLFASEIKRVDDAGRAYSKKYPMTMWDRFYAKKLAEGYVDRNADNSLTVTRKKKTALNGVKYKPIPDKDVREFWDFILEESGKAIRDNYDIEAERVSDEMIRKAKEKIQKIAEIATSTSGKDSEETVQECNALLKELFILIPRKMAVVSDCLIRDTDDKEDSHYIGNVIEREEALLGAMDVHRIISEKVKTSEMTHPESLGIHIRPYSKEKERTVRKWMGKESYLFYKGFEIENAMTRKKFRKYCEQNNINVKDVVPISKVGHHIDGKVINVVHGTANVNALNLLVQGPKINPVAQIIGRLFGDGGYYALQYLKSIGYTDVSGTFWRHGSSNKGILLMYNVAVTKAKHLDSRSHGGMRHYTAANIKPYDTVFAHSGYDMGSRRLLNDEIIAYALEEGQVDVTDVILLKGSLRR